MSTFNLIMPKMGESIMEATILKWNKQVGDKVEIDDTILEIATDKVDSEVPSPVSGVVSEILFKENDVVEIGKVIAIIKTDVSQLSNGVNLPEEGAGFKVSQEASEDSLHQNGTHVHDAISGKNLAPLEVQSNTNSNSPSRFYSPLVKNIAKKENLNLAQLNSIIGTGLNGRVTKKDVLEFLEERKEDRIQEFKEDNQQKFVSKTQNSGLNSFKTISTEGNVEILEMDRMRKLIAEHMVHSKHVAPHVTSFLEVDVTEIVKWRNKVKANFEEHYKEKITFTPIFIEAVVRAIKDFPLINVSLDGTTIIKKKDINIGMATALPSGNLIVPVIKNTDQLNLLGITKSVNDLSRRARNNQLKPDEIKDGTFTLTNVGTFGNVMGTPIINQPQVAILATGAIRKKPAVVETEYGDLIAIRHLMFLSLSYDHRIVDGFLGGSFLRRVGDYLENFDTSQLF